MLDPKYLILVPWGATPWSAGGRLAGRTPLSLTADGRRATLTWAQEMGVHKPTHVAASSEQASDETSQIIAEFHQAKRRVVSELEEIDVGLWQGLTADEFSRRYPKVYKRWREEPLGICPPEGEDLHEAGSRLMQAIETIISKADGQLPAVVLGPLAFRLVRRIVEDEQSPVPELADAAGPVIYRVREGEDQKTAHNGAWSFESILEIGTVGASANQESTESE
ncbi:MAG: histidine phosphatase family protein [Phycisphaerae bacterium]